MKKILLFSFCFLIASFAIIFDSKYASTKDYTGCYICKGKSSTYVKYRGDDTFEKRKKAKALGCDVGGTSGSCDAANYTILGTVD